MSVGDSLVVRSTPLLWLSNCLRLPQSGRCSTDAATIYLTSAALFPRIYMRNAFKNQHEFIILAITKTNKFIQKEPPRSLPRSLNIINIRTHGIHRTVRTKHSEYSHAEHSVIIHIDQALVLIIVIPEGKASFFPEYTRFFSYVFRKFVITITVNDRYRLCFFSFPRILVV